MSVVCSGVCFTIFLPIVANNKQFVLSQLCLLLKMEYKCELIPSLILKTLVVFLLFLFPSL